MAIRRREGVSYEPSGDTVVILDVEGTSMTTLNPVGARIWLALDGERDAEALAKDLSLDFDGVTVEALQADIEEFAASLVTAGLVEID